MNRATKRILNITGGVVFFSACFIGTGFQYFLNSYYEFRERQSNKEGAEVRIFDGESIDARVAATQPSEMDKYKLYNSSQQ